MRFLKLEYIIIILICFSCEDIVDVKIPNNGSGSLVVEAFLDTNPTQFKGSYIRLSRSVSFDESINSKEVKDAEIILINSNGDSIPFIDFGSNSYILTDSLKLNQTYKLKITIENVEYESEWQSAPSPVQIDTISFMTRAEILANSPPSSRPPRASGFYPSVAFTDLGGEKNYYAIDILHTRYPAFLFLGQGILVKDEEFRQGSKLPLGYLWFNLLTEFNDETRIELISINQNTYEYFDQLKSINGPQSPFSTPPFPTSQNIFNVNDPDEIVLGHFSIATTTRKRAKFIP